MILLLMLCCWEDTVGGIPWVKEYMGAHFPGYCKYYLRCANWIYSSNNRLASFINEPYTSPNYSPPSRAATNYYRRATYNTLI